MKNISIILADDHRIVRQGFKSLLEKQRGFSVIRGKRVTVRKRWK